MTTLTKIIVTTLLSLLLLSCNHEITSDVRGNGNVKTKNRQVNEPFNSISANIEVVYIYSKLYKRE